MTARNHFASLVSPFKIGSARLRSRLLLIFIAAIVPAVLAIGYVQSAERAAARDRTLADNLRLARLAADRQATVFEGARRLLLTLAKFPNLVGDDVAGCHELMAKVLADHAGYFNVSVRDADGTLFCAASPSDPDLRSQESAQLDRAALDAGRATMSGYHVGAERPPAMLVAQPVLDADHRLRRVIVASVALNELNHVRIPAELPSGATLTLFDRTRRILTRVPDGAASTGQYVAENAVTAAIAAGAVQESVAEGTGAGGVRRLNVIVPVRASMDTGLYLEMTVDSAAAFADSDRVFQKYLWLLATVVCGAAIAAASAAHVLVLRPVAALKTVAHEIAAGDLSARAEFASAVTGITDLGEAFNAMAAALDERHRELRASQDRYRLLFEQNPHAMWVFDRSTLQFLEVNESALRRYGYSREEFLAMRVTDIRPKEDVPRLTATLAGHGPAWAHSGTWRHRLKSGDLIDVEIVSHQIDLGGVPAQLVTAQDVTQRRTLEEQLRQAQKMEAIGQLAGGVAHDFNNLLTAIKGFAGFLAESLQGDAERLADIRQIEGAADRAAELTRQLLAFGRKQILSVKVLHVGDITTELAPMLRRLLGEAIDLKTTVGDRGLVKADPGQLQQVVINLAVNARDAMHGRGKLTIETCDVVLDDAFARRHAGIAPGRHVMLVVSDDGDGMRAETLKRIFEPFFTTKPKDRGTGLGLATVYGIVKQSGGTIWVYSEVGRGTSFKVYLPTTDDVGQAEPLKKGHEAPRGSESILLVEDEELVREFVSKILARQGYAVHAAADPKSAIAYAAGHTGAIDLVFTDVVLPDMSGRTMAGLLTQSHPEAKVLYMSGYADHAIVRQGVLEPGTPFLQKPFTSSGLARKVREVLDARMAAT